MRVDVIELCRDDEGVHERGPVAATLGAGEEPRLPPERDATQSSFGRIVAEADASVTEEGGEAVPQPAAAGRHVCRGFRQSIPSSR
jgi:hypothetical protein